MTTTRNGSRQALPENAQRVCASCLAPRRNVRIGWSPITRDGAVVGWTCPDCPTYAEPIRRATSGRYLAVVGLVGTDGKRKQTTKRFTELPNARAWVAEVRAGGKASPTYSDPSRLTVRQLADRWIAKRDAEVGTPGGIRRNTLSGYASALSSLLELIGDRPAREITPDDVEAALRKLATEGGRHGKPLAHRSLVYALGALRQVFAFAKRARWVLENPASEAKAPREAHGADTGSKAPRRWSPAQLIAFRSHVDALPLDSEPWLKVGMRLTLCGLRRSEVLGLDWSNVDVATGAVRIAASRTKDGVGHGSTVNGTKTENSRRTVQADTIHPGTAAALKELWLAQGCPADGLVIREVSVGVRGPDDSSIGEPVQPDAYSRRFMALCKSAGVPYLGSIHNTRHTLATALKEAGVPDHQAAALLGHDVATYRRFYLVVDDDGAAEAATVAGRLFAAQ